MSLSAKLEEVLHGGALVLRLVRSKPVRAGDPGTSGFDSCLFLHVCKRRREGMAPVRKTGSLRSKWVRSPPLAPVGPMIQWLGCPPV